MRVPGRASRSLVSPSGTSSGLMERRVRDRTLDRALHLQPLHEEEPMPANDKPTPLPELLTITEVARHLGANHRHSLDARIGHLVKDGRRHRFADRLGHAYHTMSAHAG